MPTHVTFDFDALKYAATTTPNTRGGRYVKVGYGPSNGQVNFMLGLNPLDTIRTPYGAEFASPDDPTSGKVMKLELTEDKLAFMQQLEQTTIDAANTNSQAYFGRPVPNATHNSAIKENGEGKPLVLKVKIAEGSRATQVMVTTLQDGEFTPQVPGTVDDIKPGSMLLPILRVQGGMYFINRTFGLSFVADKVLVVKEGTSASEDDFNFGDVPMKDAADTDDTTSDA